MVSVEDKKRESHFLFCTPHPCPEWGVSLYFEKCLPAFCVVGGIDCVRDSKVGTPYPPLSGPTPRNGKSVSHVFSTIHSASVFSSHINNVW